MSMLSNTSGTDQSEHTEMTAALFEALSGSYRRAAMLVDTQALTDDALAVAAAVDDPKRAYYYAAAACLLAREGSMDRARRLIDLAYGIFARGGCTRVCAALLHAWARFEIACGRFADALAICERAVAHAGAPVDSDALVRGTRARVLLMTDNVIEAQRVLAVSKTTILSAEDDVACVAAAVGLAAATRNQEMVRTYLRADVMRKALMQSRMREAFEIAHAYIEAWQAQLCEVDAISLLKRMLRSIIDPLDAVEILADAAAFADIHDAQEAVSLLEAQAKREDFVFVAALHRLACASIERRRNNVQSAVALAADAARRFKTLGARRWEARAMDELVTISSRVESQTVPDAPRLTARQKQVAALLRSGCSNKDIARALAITEHTVERHVHSILDEYGFRSRWQLLQLPPD